MDDSKSFLRKINQCQKQKLTDLSWREIGLIAPLLFLMLFMGVYPRPFLNKARETVVAIQERVTGGDKGGSFDKVESKTAEVKTPEAH